jgi:hypothetical protein
MGGWKIREGAICCNEANGAKYIKSSLFENNE